MNLRKISPKIYAAVAAAGVVTTAYLAVKAVPKAEERIRRINPRTKMERFWAALPVYLPAVGSGGITIASIFGLVEQNMKFAIAYGLGQTALRLYSDYSPVETKQRVAEELFQSPAIVNGELIPLDTTSGPEDQIVKFHDYLSNRDFHASRNQIKDAMKEFEEGFLKVSGKGSLNELYFCFHNPDELGPIGYTGDVLGWNYSDQRPPMPLITADFDSFGMLCPFLDYVNPPQEGYDNEFA